MPSDAMPTATPIVMPTVNPNSWKDARFSITNLQREEEVAKVIYMTPQLRTNKPTMPWSVKDAQVRIAHMHSSGAEPHYKSNCTLL